MKRLLLLLLPLWIFLVSLQFKYPAEVSKVYDGDTITVTVDLGLGVYKTETIRLYGLNAPEVRGAEKSEGIKSRDVLRKMILNKTVTLYTLKDKRGKYGRLLGIIHYDGKNINKWLIDNGYAEAKDY